MKGFVLLYRTFTRDEIWTSEPAVNRTMAFLDLLLLASHKAGTLSLRNTEIHVEPGDVPYSIRFLAKRWKTSRFFVEKFLEYLSERGSVKVIKGKNTSIIRLLNWNKYQVKQDPKTPRQKTDPPPNAISQPPACPALEPPGMGNSRPSENPPNELKTLQNPASTGNLQPPKTQNTSHNQQCINAINNYIKENIQSPDPSGLCALLLQKIVENHDLRRIPPFNKWKSEISDMLNEGIPFEKIRRIIEFSQDHKYWKSRIRSAISLNDNFDSLDMQMMEEEEKKLKNQTKSVRVLL